VQGRLSIGQVEADPKFYLVILVAMLGVVSMVWATFWFLRVSRLVDEVRSWRFGLRGEQAVAEKLAERELAAAGYVVFHDLPAKRGGKEWNVDHVVVGPGGVFVLETKVRAKRNATRDQEEAKVIVVGKRASGPWGGVMSVKGDS
jgi:Nuclease-related domain